MTETVTACRACGAGALTPILSLGDTPLANALLTREQLDLPERKYPLDLVLCTACSLVQITTTVPGEEMFGEYLYFSSFSDTMLRHAKELAGRVVSERKLGKKSLVVEVASNDGYLLQYYKQAGVEVLGVEPARNIAKVASEKGIPTVCEFFGVEVATRLASEGKRADVIHAHNVLAHVADLNGVVRGFATLLANGGVVIVEAPYVKELIDHTEFDTIYHEHLCYFSLTALDSLFRRQGLTIVNVEEVAIHGGTLRIFATPSRENVMVSDAVRTLLAEEAAWGVDNPDAYREFSDNVKGIRTQLRSMLGEFKEAGRSVAAYGASAKGSTLLNYAGIGAETLDFVADRSTVKQGRYTPGTHLRIYSADKLLEAMPDYVLLLTWNFADEIMAQQSEYRARGGKFVIPVPGRSCRLAIILAADRMKFTELSLSGAFVIDIDARADERGLFARTFCKDEFAERGLETAIVQESISFNERRGTVRGLHYQMAPHGEAKSVRCTAGAVHDVIVDLRGGSPTFGKWAAVELSAANRRTIYIPVGFAHGFQTLVDGSELLYQMSTEYVAESARGVRWDDEALGIDWPIVEGVIISARDAELPTLEAIRVE